MKDKGALFSEDRKHRHLLWRKWGDGPGVMFIGLNPSTADEEQDDPTIRRCIGYARDWGYETLWMCNLFSLRSTDPSNLYKEYPQSNENISTLAEIRNKVDKAIVAWGNHGAIVQKIMEWPRVISELLSPVYCFGVTKAGQPKHPLYLAKDAGLMLYKEAGNESLET